MNSINLVRPFCLTSGKAHKLVNVIGTVAFFTATPIIAFAADRPRNDAPPPVPRQQQEELQEEILLPTPEVSTTNNQQLPTALTVKGLLEARSEIANNLEHLKNHPQLLEQLMAQLLLAGDVENLKILIPIYQQYPNRDESLIEWSQAIIAQREGDLKTAIRLYRKINSALPDQNLLQFQMAATLFADKQYEAARTEFTKLRSANLTDKDQEIIEQYLNAINKGDDWSFYAGISFLNDPNINNAPDANTQLVLSNGASVTSSSTPQSGQGFSYNASVDKNWNVGDNNFVALHLGVNGSYYWNNQNYNDLTADLGIGVGYRSAFTKIEFIPFFRDRLYAKGSNGDGSGMSQYSKSFGFRIQASQQLSPRWRYQGYLSLSEEDYISTYRYLDGSSNYFGNTFSYQVSPSRYFYGGIDYAKKNAMYGSDTYHYVRGRLGWGEAWSNGLSTQLGIGVGHRSYSDKDFWGIRRSEDEYTVNASIWHRGLHFWGVTPKINWNYRVVDGNHPFYNTDKHNIYLSLSKSF